MPILEREIDLFPDDLLELAPLGSTESDRWWAMYTLARREKELMRRLRAMEIPFYCPLLPRRSRSRAGRVRTSFCPLFSGYVFVRADADQRLLALTTNCISQTIPVADAEELLRDLRQIRVLIEANVPLSPESRIQPGHRVRVRRGCLRGIEGTVLKRQSGDRLLVSVHFLQQGASVALGDFDVECI
jgi:transcription antitermination factor NusG